MPKQVQGRKPPIYAADAKMFRKVVFEFVPALLHVSVSRDGQMMRRWDTNSVKALDVGNVLVHNQLQLVRKVCNSAAATAGTCSKRHEGGERRRGQFFNSSGADGRQITVWA